VSSFIIDSMYWCVAPEDFHGPWKQTLEIVSRRNVYRYLFTLWRRLISSHVGPLAQRTTTFFRLEGPPSTVGERSKKTDIVCREGDRRLNGNLQRSYPDSVYHEDRVTSSDHGQRVYRGLVQYCQKKISKVGLILVAYAILSRPRIVRRAGKHTLGRSQEVFVSHTKS